MLNVGRQIHVYTLLMMNHSLKAPQKRTKQILQHFILNSLRLIFAQITANASPNCYYKTLIH